MSSETETRKPDNKKPHFYVENTFKELFTSGDKNIAKDLSDHSSANQCVNGRNQSRQNKTHT